MILLYQDLWQKCIKLNNISTCQYSVNKNIRFKTPMLRSDMCDYHNAYMVVKARITVVRGNNVKSNFQGQCSM